MGLCFGRALCRNSNAGPCQGPNKTATIEQTFILGHFSSHSECQKLLVFLIKILKCHFVTASEEQRTSDCIVGNETRDRVFCLLIGHVICPCQKFEVFIPYLSAFSQFFAIFR